MPPVQRFSNYHTSYTPFGTQVEPRSLKISSFWKLEGQNCQKVDKMKLQISRTYILGSWEPLKTFSKHFLVLITPKSTYGLSMNLISALFYTFYPVHALKCLPRGPKTVNLVSFISY